MHGVAVASQRANADVVFCKRGDKLVILGRVCKQLRGVAMCLTGITARTKLYGVYAKTCDDPERLVQSFLSV